jgi:hypothetical protein
LTHVDFYGAALACETRVQPLGQPEARGHRVSGSCRCAARRLARVGDFGGSLAKRNRAVAPGFLDEPLRVVVKLMGRQAEERSAAQAGASSDLVTMLNCYDIPDDDANLAVTSEPRRRWEKPENRTNAVAAAAPS